MPAKRHAKAGPASARRNGSIEATLKTKAEEIAQHELTPAVHTDGTEVEVTLGLNENLGDFNHAKVFVSVRLPATRGNAEQTADDAYALADRKVDEYRKRFLGLTD